MAHVTESYPACGMPWSSLNLKFVAAYADLWLFGHERGRCGQCIALCGEKDCNPVLLVDQHEGSWKHRQHDWWVSEEMYTWLSGMHHTKKERLQLHRPINSYECRGIWDGTMIGDAEPPGLLKNLHPDNLVKTYFHADLGDTRETMVMHTMEEDGDHLQVEHDGESKPTKSNGNSSATAFGPKYPLNNMTATTVTEIKTTTTIMAIVIKTKTSTETTKTTTTWRHEALNNPHRYSQYLGNPPDEGPRIGDYRTLTMKNNIPRGLDVLTLTEEVAVKTPEPFVPSELALRTREIGVADAQPTLRMQGPSEEFSLTPYQLPEGIDPHELEFAPTVSHSGDSIFKNLHSRFLSPQVTATVPQSQVRSDTPAPESTSHSVHMNAWKYFFRGFFRKEHFYTLTKTVVSVETVTPTVDPIQKNELDERDPGTATATDNGEYVVQTILPTVSIYTVALQPASSPSITTLTSTQTLSLIMKSTSTTVTTSPYTFTHHLTTTVAAPTKVFSAGHGPIGRFARAVLAAEGKSSSSPQSNNTLATNATESCNKTDRPDGYDLIAQGDASARLHWSDLSVPSLSSLAHLAKRKIGFWEDRHDYHPLWYFRKKSSAKDPPPFCGMPWESLHLDYVAAGRHMRPSDCGTCFKVCSVFHLDCVYILIVENTDKNGVNMRKKKSWDFGPFMKHWKKVDTHWCGGIWNGTMLPEWGGDDWHGGRDHPMRGGHWNQFDQGPIAKPHYHMGWDEVKVVPAKLDPPPTSRSSHSPLPPDPRATYQGAMPPGELPYLPATFPFNTRTKYSHIKGYKTFLPDTTTARPPQ
ncbi:hypothetical protein L228DRAFT_262170 [Xylona heveae TC161]|uniref:Uncharacterized protein n=1 Tax=Xylona heveae (strain CBS 132557 / TC161) TaxID=1328760 RepID=A0A165FLH2_XYLHT|nr:hypothetical protein L228DRAFT_262170 [Xylona heveae TC161]KZF21117.1 hypothetical protein L228DRAFT_262170 [Xylona heveae TC161]